MALEENDMRIC